MRTVESARGEAESPAEMDAKGGECPVCESPSVRPYTPGRRWTGELELRRCDICDFVFVPQRDGDRVRHGTEYHSARENGEDAVASSMNATSFLSYWAWRLRWARGVSLLDVGCAEGRLLQVARSMGFRSEGIDVSDYHAVRWFEASLTASAATAEEYSRTHRESFDVVMARQVIEHVKDPVSFLRGCTMMLKPGGVCLIETGDPHSWQARFQGASWAYWTPREGLGAHVSFISRRTAQVLGRRVGLLLRQSVEQLRYLPFSAYARTQSRSTSHLPTMAKFALHRTRLSAARCYWFERAPAGRSA